WPSAQRIAVASFGSNFDSVLPAAAIVSGMVSHSLLYTGVVAFVACFVAAQVRHMWLRALLFVAGALATVGGNWASPGDFVRQWVGQVLLLGVLVVGVRWLMRTNIFGCFLVLAITALVEAAAELLGQPNGFYRLNGYGVITALVVLLAWPSLAWRL